jgi:hypothetical protein
MSKRKVFRTAKTMNVDKAFVIKSLKEKGFDINNVTLENYLKEEARLKILSAEALINEHNNYKP